MAFGLLNFVQPVVVHADAFSALGRPTAAAAHISRKGFGAPQLTLFGIVDNQTNGASTMPDNEDLDQKKPGEKAPGKFHFNPGNKSGKTVKVGKIDPRKNQKPASPVKATVASNLLCRRLA